MLFVKRLLRFFAEKYFQEEKRCLLNICGNGLNPANTASYSPIKVFAELRKTPHGFVLKKIFPVRQCIVSAVQRIKVFAELRKMRNTAVTAKVSFSAGCAVSLTGRQC
jgi:hypothetical protein